MRRCETHRGSVATGRRHHPASRADFRASQPEEQRPRRTGLRHGPRVDAAGVAGLRRDDPALRRRFGRVGRPAPRRRDPHRNLDLRLRAIYLHFHVQREAPGLELRQEGRRLAGGQPGDPAEAGGRRAQGRRVRRPGRALPGLGDGREHGALGHLEPACLDTAGGPPLRLQPRRASAGPGRLALGL